MNSGALSTKSNHIQYTEVEAAQELGVTVEQLRTLIRSHIAQSEEDLNHLSVASFHASDLLVLKILAGQTGLSAAAADSTK